VLQVTHLSKHYVTPQGPLPILADVTFALAPGESVAIMGPSGSGKSTLLYILGALEPPSSGTVVLDGRNPFELSEHDLAAFRNRSIGFVFQDHCLLPHLSVLENVLAPTLVGSREDHVADRARELIRTVGLDGRVDHRPGELSGGEKQRVAVARAMIRRPRLLLCDEPTGNLDARSADVVARMLLELHRDLQTMLVVVTHSLDLSQRFDRRFELHEGQLR
jgi:lipoprotein-releasing system ATP-binding protein